MLKRYWLRYLLFSCLYYELDISLIQDYEYDKVCKYLLEHEEEFHSDPTINHKELYCRDSLEAGNGSGINFPEGIISKANYFREKLCI